jgi:hypothetical protein
MKASWIGMLALSATAVGAGPALAQSVAVTGLAGQSVTLSAADLAAMPRTPVTLHLDGGRTEACEGVQLSDILARVAAPQGKALRGPEMADIIVIKASDGYRVALALAETDPGMRSEKIVLADKCNGAAMAAPEGPFRLVVENDSRPARSARQVTTISLARAP